MMRVQAFYTYERLGALWGVQPGTVKDWVSDLRRTSPTTVYVTYRLVRGHQRTAFLAQSTAEALQALHFPKDRLATKLRGGLSRNKRPPSYIRRRMAAEAAERAALRPEHVVPTAPARAVTAGAVGRTPVVRKLTLPPMPSRDGILPGHLLPPRAERAQAVPPPAPAVASSGLSRPDPSRPGVRRLVLPPMPRRDAPRPRGPLAP
jgi:hypothetical protein